MQQQTDPPTSEIDHICRLTADDEKQTFDQNYSDRSKPERQQTNLSASEQVFLPSFDQGLNGPSAALILNKKEETKPTFHSAQQRDQKMSCAHTKPSQCNNSVLAAGPGALVTELISEDEIETVTLSDEPSLTIDVSAYIILILYQC